MSLVPCPGCGAMVEPKHNKERKFVIPAHNPPPDNSKGVSSRELCRAAYELVSNYKPNPNLVG